MARGDCPQCHAPSFSPPIDPHGAVRCTTCFGTFFFGRGAVALVEHDVGIAKETLLQLATEFGRPGRACADCEHAMRITRVKDVDVDFCGRCGGLFLDAGELEKVSGGKHREPVRPVPTENAFIGGDDAHMAAHASHALAVTTTTAMVPDLNAPGRPMLDSLTGIDAFLGSAPAVAVKQRHRLGEVITGIEMANQYAVSPVGGGVGFAKETTSGFLAVIARLFLPAIRALEIEFENDYGGMLFVARRKMFFFFSKLVVEGNDGSSLGSVERKFDIIYKRYELRNREGRLFALVKSPFWKLWKFPVTTVDGREVAAIQKNWGGFMREVMTDADQFVLDFQGHPFSVDERAVLLATLLSIDLDFFSRNNGKGGVFRLLGS